MSQLKAVKYSGAGNLIFLILEQPDQNISKISTAKKLCDPAGVFGGDGVLFLRKDPSGKTDYIWDFFNADGSSAEMCGNAARNAGQFCCEELKSSKNKFSFQTVSGKIACERKDKNIYEVEMPSFKVTQEKLELTVNNKTEKFLFVDTGVPHLVFKKNDDLFKKMKEHSFLDWAKSFRNHPQLAPQGANVTFISEQASQKQAVTYERGVENFTQACGTGAVAAAVFFEKQKPAKHHEIHMPGGVLIVDLKSNERPHLIGPSEKIKEYFIEGNS